MQIGIPKELKQNEGRIALTPMAVSTLVKAGHSVYVELGAGTLSGYSDSDYLKAGATVLPGAAQVYKNAQLIVKVKEPEAKDLDYLQSRHILFSFLHLAAMPALTQRLCKIGLTAIGLETVSVAGQLPLLAPMSAIAGRVAAQTGSNLLYEYRMGRGILLGGVEGTEKGEVVVLGAGVAGSHAAEMAACFGANVTLLDLEQARLDAMTARCSNIQGQISTLESVVEAVSKADLLIGAVLIPGARAPHLVNTDMVRNMKNGSVIIDISVDQGGCIETIQPTSYAAPTYIKYGVLHFGVTNIPGAVPRTASQALSSAILPYVEVLAGENWQQNAHIMGAINVKGGEIIHPAVKNVN